MVSALSRINHDKPSGVLEGILSSAHDAEPSLFGGEAAEKAKVCLLDFFSCAFEAANLPWSLQAAEVATPLESGATIIGQAKRVTVEDAAFANGVAGHGLVREDMHAGAISHFGVVIWPALLALCEKERISGEALLRGAILGYELGGRIGRELMTPEVARLFRPTGLLGPMAAAFACASALDLDREVTRNAVALAANGASGLNQWPHHGADEMYFHPGFAARNALRALSLARAGAYASPAILEGEAGVFAAYGRTRLQKAIELFPGGDAEIFHVFNKQVPACNFAQSPCQAALYAFRKAARPAADIVKVGIQTYDAALNYPGCASKGPFARPLAAKMSIAFGVAATLACGEIAETNYARLEDAEIARLVAAVEFSINDELNRAFPARQGARVTLHFRDGTSESHGLEDIEFADRELITSRFMQSASAVVGSSAAGVMLTAINQIETLDHTDVIIRRAGKPSSNAARPKGQGTGRTQS